MKLKCGCKIYYNHLMSQHDIEFCPLHEAAEKLLEACRFAHQWLEQEIDIRKWDGHPQTVQMSDVVTHLRWALKKAKGDQP